MLKKQKSLSFPFLSFPSSLNFLQIANSVFNKGKFALPRPLFSCLEVLSSASDKAKVFAKNFSSFSRNSHLDESGITLPIFSFGTNIKLHNISVKLPSWLKKVKTNLDMSKASGPDCIPVVVLQNCGPGI